MNLVYKLVRANYSSLTDKYGRVVYGTDWQTVPYNGAYCSETGEGITQGGVGPRLIQLEVKGKTLTRALPRGVTTWRSMRRTPWQPTAKQQTRLDTARAKCEAVIQEIILAQKGR